MEKKYYKNIDLVRVISCLIILLYHLNILKGGYLVVCTFFVLSGYLAVLSASNKDKFSLKDYYKNKFLKLYLPVIVISFISIAVISIIKNINWINLKPETTSVLFGYNNYWQLNANLDYFTRHIDSPFMHLWYIAILLQFELIFPIVYILFKKIGDKFHKFIPIIMTLLLAIISYLYFYILCDKNIMIAYYDTFARLFSLLFGMSFGFIKIYYDTVGFKKIPNLMFYIYLILLIIPTFFIDASSKYFAISMIVITLISCRLIDYGTLIASERTSIFSKVIKSLASVSYEIYLVQYPVIFLLQEVAIDNYIKIILTIFITILLAYIIHNGIDFKKNKVFNWILRVLIILISLFGLYQYVIAKDHTKEMKELEKQLNQNAEMMKLKQEEYAKQLEKEKEAWELELKNLEDGVADLNEVVQNIHIVGVGDSVMLGAITDLYKQFPKGYFDAKESRTAWVVNGILKELKTNNMLGDPIVLGLGANGDCPEWCKLEILDTIGDRNIFWLTTTWNKGIYVNNNIKKFASKHNNVHIIDWADISKGHNEYFVADGIHLTEIGREEYSKAIYDSIYQMYLNEINSKKDEMIKARDEENKKKISFYGNDLLLNAFDYIEEEFKSAKYIINKDFDYESLKEELKNSINDNSLDYNLVFIFDSSFKISNDEYKELIELCNNHKIYVLLYNESINYNDVEIIDMDINKYLMADKIHLTDEGNKLLSKVLKDTIKEE